MWLRSGLGVCVFETPLHALSGSPSFSLFVPLVWVAGVAREALIASSLLWVSLNAGWDTHSVMALYLVQYRMAKHGAVGCAVGVRRINDA